MTDIFDFFKGEHANRILILGESHYGSGIGFKTADVVKRYLTEYANGKQDDYKFFEKIVKSFGVDPAKEREAFWSSTYFKNYVCDALCGIGDRKAKNQAKNNRTEYNDVLFRFINENKISTVFVFSRLVYNNSLPSYYCKAKEHIDCYGYGTLMVGRRRDYVSHCIYLADVEHKYSSVLLDHDVEFFGLRHPSGRCGFIPNNYSKYLSERLQIQQSLEEKPNV